LAILAAFPSLTLRGGCERAFALWLPRPGTGTIREDRADPARDVSAPQGRSRRRPTDNGRPQVPRSPKGGGNSTDDAHPDRCV